MDGNGIGLLRLVGNALALRAHSVRPYGDVAGARCAPLRVRPYGFGEAAVFVPAGAVGVFRFSSLAG